VSTDDDGIIEDSDVAALGAVPLVVLGETPVRPDWVAKLRARLGYGERPAEPEAEAPAATKKKRQR
jgi:hypothetical protein